MTPHDPALDSPRGQDERCAVSEIEAIDGLGDWLSGDEVRETIARAVYHHAGLPTAWMLLGDGQAAWLGIADHVVVDLIETAFAALATPASSVAAGQGEEDEDESDTRRLAGRFAALMAMVSPATPATPATRPPTDDPDAATARGEEASDG